MRIIKTPNDIKMKELARKKANVGCGMCPTCGCNKIKNIFEINNSEKCIEVMTFRVEQSGFFKLKFGSQDNYRCKVCGTEWVSEIY